MRILLLDDGNKGNSVQSLGIASRMGGRALSDRVEISLAGPVYRLPGRAGTYPVSREVLAILCRLRLWKAAGILLFRLLPSETSELLKRSVYDLVISAGAVLAPVNLILSRLYNAKSVNIMLPSVVSLKDFDYLVMPYHDYMKLGGKKMPNAIVTLGAPNSIEREALREAAGSLADSIRPEGGFKDLLGIVIGGDDQNYSISPCWAGKLVEALKSLDRRWQFLLTTSKRTAPGVVEFIKEASRDWSRLLYAEFPGYGGQSHYHGILGLARVLLVTEDSINMVSEAVTSGRPVIVLGVERKTGKKHSYRLTMQRFIEKGLIRYIPCGRLDTLPEVLGAGLMEPVAKVDEAARCAEIIRKGLGDK